MSTRARRLQAYRMRRYSGGRRVSPLTATPVSKADRALYRYTPARIHTRARSAPAGRGAAPDALNPAQRSAVEHGHGAQPAAPLLVIAGAGSGKTSMLAHRVAHLLAHGADPQSILLLTFSRRAALELASRVERIVARLGGAPGAAARDALGWAGTFHGIGARLLREYAGVIGLDASWTISDREDAADLMNLVRHERGLSARERRFPTKTTCLAIYSRVVNTGEPLERVLAATFPWCAEWERALRGLFAAYVDAKQRQQVLDYDDLLLYWAQMMCEPLLAAELGERFQRVLVDEYQDTNRLQAEILLCLKPDGRGVTVVGDDAQSIYAFRGATVRNIRAFPGQYAPAAGIVTLEQNYRSTQPILDAANGVIGLAPEAFSKRLWTERQSARKPRLVTVRDEAEQGRYVVDQVLEQREAGIALKEQAVLFRTAHHSAPLEIELTRRNIPFLKFGGLRFLDAAHVKDLLAVLRWAQNPRDRVAGFRVLQLLPGVGPATAAMALDAVAACASPLDALWAVRVSARVVADWADFVALAATLFASAAAWPDEVGQVRRWYEPHLERRHDDARARPTLRNSNASPPPIRVGPVFLPTWRSIRPTRPAPRRPIPDSTRTI
jgi:DNA helicase-2/ATP-dependent DNA helicase PcrA